MERQELNTQEEKAKREGAIEERERIARMARQWADEAADVGEVEAAQALNEFAVEVYNY